MEKIRVGLFFGGRSMEHEVSIRSMLGALASLDRSKLDISLFGIGTDGSFYELDESKVVELAKGSKLTRLDDKTILLLQPITNFSKQSLFSIAEKIDVAFPITHGPFGEDGCIQGLFEILSIPYVGSRVLGSSICMDKDVSKRLLKEAGLPVVRHIAIEMGQDFSFSDILQDLDFPIFVKPANLGSSVGISKVRTKDALERAMQIAFSFDTKIVLEQGIDARDLECSIIGNQELLVSEVGEVCTSDEFYSYKIKCSDQGKLSLHIPAEISPEIKQLVQMYSKKAFRALLCRGFARVDFLLTSENTLVLNEVNTLPGLVPESSLFPKLFEESGISNMELFTILIELAIGNKGSLKAIKIK